MNVRDIICAAQITSVALLGLGAICLSAHWACRKKGVAYPISLVQHTVERHQRLMGDQEKFLQELRAVLSPEPDSSQSSDDKSCSKDPVLDIIAELQRLSSSFQTESLGPPVPAALDLLTDDELPASQRIVESGPRQLKTNAVNVAEQPVKGSEKKTTAPEAGTP